MENCTIYLVRHGETEWNLAGKLQGQQDSTLTKRGKSQAKNISRELKNVHFDAIFSSDLNRAKRTAEIINLEHQLVHTTSRLLRERSFADFEGKSYSQFQAAFKKLLSEREKLTEEEKFSHKIDDSIESDQEVVARNLRFLREIAIRYQDKTVLIVSHGGVMRALLIHLGYGTSEQISYDSITNTGYFVLDCDGVEFFIKRVKGINLTKP